MIRSWSSFPSDDRRLGLVFLRLRRLDGLSLHRQCRRSLLGNSHLAQVLRLTCLL